MSLNELCYIRSISSKMKLLVSTLLAALLVVHLQTTQGTHDLSASYRFSATLDPNGQYELYWNYNLTAGTISFAVRVETTGWVGFGLSPNGQMPGSDVVIGWVDSNGGVHFHDRYAEGRYLPPIDASQDWFLVRGEEEGGYTILEFTRNLTTCDDKDLDVEADTSRVIWSWSSADPSSPSDITQHENQGTTSLNLLGGLNEPRQDRSGAASFVIRNENLTIPAVDTTYWCSVFRLPQEIRQQERYVFKLSPDITSESSQYVHHIVVYLCEALDHSHVGESSECENANLIIQQCRGGGTVIAAWAVGGIDFYYPENVAFPVGGPGNSQFIMLEMHYDNPQLVSGVVDSSGMEFSYTNTPSQHRAGFLSIAHAVRKDMVIPPNAENYTISSICTGSCTQAMFPPEGITVFGSLLHTHLVGHGLVLQHFRRNEECGVLEELEPIDINLKYDFNYQQTNILPREIQILPGDALQINCFYRTSGVHTSRVTLGGEGTREEMCVAFLAYYPQINAGFCGSLPRIPDAFAPFASQHVDPSDHPLLYQSLASNNESGIRTVLDNINWTPEAVDGLQQSVLNNDVFQFCSIDNTELARSLFRPASLPSVQCPYQAADSCTGFQPQSCCERLSVSGSAPSVTLHTLFILAAMICAVMTF